MDSLQNHRESRAVGYPPTFSVRSIEEQLQMLLQCFPCLTPPSRRLTAVPLTLPRGPFGIDGLFVIPRFEAVAIDYHEAVCLVLTLLGSRRPVKNWLANTRRSGAIRMTECYQSYWASMTDSESFVFMAAQSGRRFRNWAPAQVRHRLAPNEFSLGAFAVGCILLTHPERFSERCLWIDCPGDEYINPGCVSTSVPFFSYHNGVINFDASASDAAGPRSGSATGFTI